MRLHLCGVRGSTPAPGPDFVEIGGHTSCIAIARDEDAHPTLVLDAGTGLRTVTCLLGERPFDGTILLTHLHWDHTQGLPFFRAGDRPDAGVRQFVELEQLFQLELQFQLVIERRWRWRRRSLRRPHAPLAGSTHAFRIPAASPCSKAPLHLLGAALYLRRTPLTEQGLRNNYN